MNTNFSKKICLILPAILFIAFNYHFLSAKDKVESTEKEVLATVGKEQITLADLEKAFRKNMNRKNVKLADVPKDSVLDFLNLYIEYRLKVQDALKRGFDKDSSVIADISQNRKLLAESFLFEKKLVEPNTEQMLELRKREKQVAVILISNEKANTLQDTLEIFKIGRAHV